MIFCFSGTGNSKHVAEIIASRGKQEIVMITENEMLKTKTYTITDGLLGFVFPIYWWGMPKLVEEFVKSISLSLEENTYTFAVCTFGLVDKNGLDDLDKALRDKGIELNATFEVRMVDNYIVGYKLANREKQREILEKAEKTIQEIVVKVDNREKEKIQDRLAAIKPLVHHVYKTVDHKRHFYTADSCIGCGRCAKECPCSAIQMKEQKPFWTKDCSFCLKCIHTCPKEAIQYKKTEGRSRYTYTGVAH